MTTPAPSITETEVRARVLAAQTLLQKAHDALYPLSIAFWRKGDHLLFVRDVLSAISDALEAVDEHGKLWEVRAQQEAVE